MLCCARGCGLACRALSKTCEARRKAAGGRRRAAPDARRLARHAPARGSILTLIRRRKQPPRDRMTHGEPDPARYVRMPDNNPSPTHYYLRLSVTALAAVVFLFLHREHELAALRAENHQLRSDVQASSKLQSLIGGVGSTQQPDSGAGSSEDSHNTCTCEEAKKSPLFLEYAYRSGLCPGAPANLGPSFATEDCLEDINAEYNFEGNFNGARPVIFNESAAHAFPVFDGVTFARLPPGEVTAQWECSKATGCHDCKPGTPQCSTERGFAMMWVPEGAEKTTARILYVHGGSWLTGSPTSASYAPFCAMIAKTSGLPVLAIDYPLAPVGKFETILEQVGRAVHWLATHDPSVLAAGGDAAAALLPIDEAPMLFISGDSSS